ncbi:serine/threonine-protein kinase [Streptomyces oceani]|uniref:Protein kinase domain-containing protein n=1 Tax=Streptomyces oceani TaxID=1075402 RepID=A0A1E7JXF5_9ACTN|nr:serine/threonine-protein kinase [Streptomyces oceani]OEU96325.1 hypothetical protein AN216_20870 [Streptomyces oceani]
MEQLEPWDPRVIGGYRLIGRLGEGGMGRVYLARSDRGRTVAVKLVREELTEQDEFRARFRQEVRAARRVGGRWTAAVLDDDTEATQPWVATGYIAGPSLQRVVADSGRPLPARSVRLLAAGLAHALRDVHDAGIVHRDLKPSNVLITIDGPRVIDFGIARALDTTASKDGLTRTGAIVGTPGFLSPEQVRGDSPTPASDVFCLGSVLAYAATGEPPFGGADSGVHAVLYRIAQEEAELSGLPEELRELVTGCLAKNPDERPTLDEVLAATDEPESADEPWLPGGLVAQLGRHATELLEAENPSGDTGGQGERLSPQTGAAGAADAAGAGDEAGVDAGAGAGAGAGADAADDVPAHDPPPGDAPAVRWTPTTADAGAAGVAGPPPPTDPPMVHGMRTSAGNLPRPEPPQPEPPQPEPSRTPGPELPGQHHHQAHVLGPPSAQQEHRTPVHQYPALGERRPSGSGPAVVIAVLITLLVVVSGVAAYLVLGAGSEDDTADPGSSASTGQDSQENADGDDPSDPSADDPSDPKPSTDGAGDGIPSDFLGSWERSSGTGDANRYRIHVQQGELGDTVVSISATGPNFDCRFEADLRSAGPPVKLGPSRVTYQSSEQACGPGPVSRLEVSGGELRRSFADGRPTKVFSRAG